MAALYLLLAHHGGATVQHDTGGEHLHPQETAWFHHTE